MKEETRVSREDRRPLNDRGERREGGAEETRGLYSQEGGAARLSN